MSSEVSKLSARGGDKKKQPNVSMKGGTSMTCRDLMIYILSNHLEDEPVFKDGRFVGFITACEAAEKFNVGVATIYVWVSQKRLSGIIIGDVMYIPADCKLSEEKYA